MIPRVKESEICGSSVLIHLLQTRSTNWRKPSLPQMKDNYFFIFFCLLMEIINLGIQEFRTCKLSVFSVAVVRAKSFRGKYKWQTIMGTSASRGRPGPTSHHFLLAFTWSIRLYPLKMSILANSHRKGFVCFYFDSCNFCLFINSPANV